MYSMDYVSTLSGDGTIEQADGSSRFEKLSKVISTRSNLAGLTLLDYGCGANPQTFQISERYKVKAYGMEYSPDIREKIKKETDSKIFSREQIEKSNMTFDFIFLGDVIEHLTDPTTELTMLKSKLSKDGILIAQGPLQGARTFTHLLLRLFALATPRRISNFPPYHVSLATRKSMLDLLDLLGYSDIKIDCSEVDWPALSLAQVFKSPSFRNFVLVFIKCIDKCFALILPGYGSRYFLVCANSEKNI